MHASLAIFRYGLASILGSKTECGPDFAVRTRVARAVFRADISQSDSAKTGPDQG